MESKSLSLAKITKPRLLRILPRQGLFHLLDQSRAYPAIWVSGPGGSGKTTLVSSYLDERKLPCLWYQIDESDSDIATFFYYMGLAGKKAAPRKRKPLPLLTPEYALGIPTFTKRYFENLFERLKKPGVLVLDNYQEALPDSRLHEILRDALSVIPEEINVFILSRTEPPSALARARASNVLDLIGWNELRLQPGEMEDMVRLLGRREYSHQLIDYLYEKTDGWIAGLLLLLKRTVIEDIDPQLFTRFTPKEVFDYFATEIFEDADREVQQFLLGTCIFPRMTSQMAARLTGVGRAEQILSSMNRNHCFTDRRLGQETTYQYHPLFREFLLGRARDTYAPQRFAQLKDEAANLLEEDGQIEAAIALFHESGDLQNMIRLILGHAQMMVLQGRIQTLEQWLRSLPDEVLHSKPLLLYWLGACRMPVDPAEGRSLFEKALSLFESQNDTTGVFLALCGVFDSITYGFHSFKPFDQWIPRLETLSGEFISLHSPEIKAHVTFSMLLALILRQPHHHDFETWEKRALEVLRSSLGATIKIQIILPLAVHRIFTGDLTKAQYFINIYRELAKSPDITPLALLTLKGLEAYYSWASGEFEECQRTVAEGLKLASATGVYLMSLFLMGHGAAGALSSGDLSTADRFLSSMERDLDRAGAWEKETFHIVATWKALLAADFTQATFLGSLGVQCSQETGTPKCAAANHLGQALALHATGKHNQAGDQLAQAFSISRQAKTQNIEFGCHLAQAEFALDLEDEGTTLHSLQKAMSLGREQGYVNTYFWRPAVIARLCCKALEANIEVDYVQDLIRKRDLILQEPPLDIENWPWDIKIFTLGRFGMVIDGKPFKFSKKAPKKPLEMLKVLASFGQDQEISKDSLSDILWPDTEGDKAQKSFDTTLHRLRQLLDHDNAISLRDGRLSLDLRYCWVDSMAFERMLNQAEDYADKKDRKSSIQSLEKAIALYKGPFLGEDAHEPWAIPYNERLRSKFLRAIERLGNDLEEEGELIRAVECFQKAIEVDNVAEVFYQRLMICLKQLGRRTDALSVYQRCKKTLSAHLGLEPSPETKAIKESLYEK